MSTRLVLISVLAVGCGADHSSADAHPPSTIPRDASGTFAVASTLDFRVPPAAAAVIDMLVAATDGADDPSRYLVDRTIAALPDGTIKTIATGFAPLVAAYLNERLADVAPRFATGIASISHGFARIATHITTTESIAIDPYGRAVRSISGVRFDNGGAAAFAERGLPPSTASPTAVMDRFGTIVFSAHRLRLPYGTILGLGLDRSAIPAAVPGTSDLATALVTLVDCAKLGDLAAEKVGLGSPTLYRAACKAGMLAIASDVYAKLDTIDATPLELDITGTATGVDRDGNGTMDAIETGTWAGMPLDAATFTGQREQ